MSYAEDKGLTVEVYKKMKLEGKTDKEIAEAFGIGETSVYIWKKENSLLPEGLDRTPLEERGITVEKYKQMKKQFISDQDIAKKYNCTQKAIYKWKVKHGLRNFTFDDLLSDLTPDQYKEYRKQSMLDREIAEKHGVSITYLYKWKVKHGLNKKIAEKIPLDEKKLTPHSYKNLKDKGFTDKEIAGKLKCALSTLTNWKKKNGLIGVQVSMNKTESFTVDEYREYKKRKLSDAQIAEKFGVKVTTLRNWKRRMGLQLYYGIHQKITPEEYIKFKTEMNMTDRKIAEKIKVSTVTLTAWKREHNLSEYRLPSKIGRDLNITKEEYEAYREEGFTNTDIAELIVECSVNKLYALRKKWESEDREAASWQNENVLYATEKKAL